MTRALFWSIDWGFIGRSLVLIVLGVLRRREKRAFITRRLRAF